jgi:mono/diheme cytochrome c family protein
MRISKTTPGVLGSLIASFSRGALLLFMAVGVYVTATTREMKQAERGAKTGPNANLIARGQYIVEGVAACGDCHTPRDENGVSDRTRWLKGAPVFFSTSASCAWLANRCAPARGLAPGKRR